MMSMVGDNLKARICDVNGLIFQIQMTLILKFHNLIYVHCSARKLDLRTFLCHDPNIMFVCFNIVKSNLSIDLLEKVLMYRLFCVGD